MDCPVGNGATFEVGGQGGPDKATTDDGPVLVLLSALVQVAEASFRHAQWWGLIKLEVSSAERYGGIDLANEIHGRSQCDTPSPFITLTSVRVRMLVSTRSERDFKYSASNLTLASIFKPSRPLTWAQPVNPGTRW